MKVLKRHLLISLGNGKHIFQKVQNWLKGLLIGLLLTVSACASNLQMPQCAQSQVQVDPSLMVTPTYQKTLLDYLSSKPNVQTPK